MNTSEEKITSALDDICEHLCNRKATLFLGAGLNYGISNASGGSFPLGQDLSELIAQDVLEEKNLSIPLDDSAEMARLKVGDNELNNYIYRKLSEFKAGTAHLALVQLPWDNIFTTNYDLLVEVAAKSTSIKPAGNICPIYSSDEALQKYSEQDILYYKLHGSIDVANKESGRLILTKEDYRYYEEFRRKLFQRLKDDLVSRTFVFVGYSMIDPNFRQILEDCRYELDAELLPLSYSIRPGFKEVEEVFWKEKFNIQLLDTRGDEFLENLKETWFAKNLTVLSFEERQKKKYVQPDKTTNFERIGESFYRIKKAHISGVSNANLFFKGAEPSWADIKEDIAPRRELYWTLFEGIFSEMSSPNVRPNAYLITGAAGTGKTTMLKTLALDIASDFDTVVLYHVPGTPLDAQFLGPLIEKENQKRILIFLSHGAEIITEIEQFLADLILRKFPVTIVIEERKNQWLVASESKKFKSSITEFEFENLTMNEIREVLDALEKHDALGKLGGLEKDDRIEHFNIASEKELLVALRELTEGETFDNIVKDEYNKIPSDTAKEAYKYVAALGRIGLPIRYEILQQILDIDFMDLREHVFKPTEGVLISGEETGYSRHNSGFTLRTRHPTIANVIYDAAAPEDADKFEVLNRILTHLDQGRFEDSKVLEQLVRRKQLVEAFSSPENRRAVYEKLATILPGNPYVLQHRSILERDLGDYDRAIRFAKAALAKEESNQAFINTLGFALEGAARKTSEVYNKQIYLTEAMRQFELGLKKNRFDPFAYLGKYYVLKHRAELERDKDKKADLLTEAISFLEEAVEQTDQSPIVTTPFAKELDSLGSRKEAIELLEKSTKRNPENTRLRVSLVSMEMAEGNLDKAKELAVSGLKKDPSSWRLTRQLAKIQYELGQTLQVISGHYESAIRLNKGDIGLLVEYGSVLYMKGDLQKASSIFFKAKQISGSSAEKSKIRMWYRDEDKTKRIFGGSVSDIRGAAAYAMSVPGNLQAFFSRNRPDLIELKKGDNIKFNIGFNAYGPFATSIKKNITVR